jgi:NitT/TauT family transport system ATP-binding protein
MTLTNTGLAAPAGRRDDTAGTSGAELEPNHRQLDLENVVKVYDSSDGPKTVLDGVDLRVTRGEFVALVGPSGCGKSTLLRLILGQEEPTSGTLFLDGEPIGYPDPTRGIVYQQYSLFPNLTVIENIMEGHRLSMPISEFRRCKADIRHTAEEYLKTAQLQDHLHKYPHELSGGQRQRAAVLQALMPDPKVLLMDEPFGALDAGSRERMQVFLMEQWEKTGKTIIFVTHDLEEAVFIGTRVVVLSQYYTDDRTEITMRGARIVCDLAAGEKGRANSTQAKLDPRFTQMIEHIRDMGFKPDHLHHVREFDLKHSDSFKAASPGEETTPSRSEPSRLATDRTSADQRR